ncbi:MAG: MarR family transcriptional regulator [Pigmentiphaga sp.]|nr:MarR family transcriptional regulator [Pigmentiphaga sp.]
MSSLPSIRFKTPGAHGAPTGLDDPELVGMLQEGLGFLVRHTHRAFAKRLADRLVAHGISAAQWTVLRALWKEDNVSQVDLAASIRVEKASLTQVLVALEKQQLIHRTRSAEDRRRWFVSLTPEGRTLKQTLLPIGREIDQIATRSLSADELQTLKTLMARALANLTR